KEPLQAEGGEGGAVGRVTKEVRQAVRGDARLRSLDEARPGGGELGPTIVQEHVERRSPGRIGDNGRTATIPVDLTPAADGASAVAIIGSAEHGPEIVHAVLDVGHPRSEIRDYRRYGERGSGPCQHHHDESGGERMAERLTSHCGVLLGEHQCRIHTTHQGRNRTPVVATLPKKICSGEREYYEEFARPW